jgi:2'-5' RNA ligase
MCKDFNLEEYKVEVQRKISEKVEGLTQVASHKYKILCENYSSAVIEPEPYPGYTVIAKPFPIDQANQQELERVQKSLFKSVSGFVPSPPDSFHLTVAELLSGQTFTALMKQPEWDAAFAGRVNDLLDRRAVQDSDMTIRGIIAGIGAFPGVVVAIVDFDSEIEYGRIIELRNTIYGDRALMSSSVKRSYPFLGHITLGYLESAPVRGLDEVLSVIRLKEPFGWEFNINGVGLHHFSNLSTYSKAGPIYRL